MPRNPRNPRLNPPPLGATRPIYIGAGYTFAGPVNRCAYCAAPAECTDHTVPLSFVRGNHAAIRVYRFTIVSACNDCNTRAGGKLDRTFTERRARIRRSLDKAARRLLLAPDWGDDEKADMGRGLSDYIETADQAVRHLRRRLFNLASPRWPDPPVPDDLWTPAEGD